MQGQAREPEQAPEMVNGRVLVVVLLQCVAPTNPEVGTPLPVLRGIPRTCLRHVHITRAQQQSKQVSGTHSNVQDVVVSTILAAELAWPVNGMYVRYSYNWNGSDMEVAAEYLRSQLTRRYRIGRAGA